MRPRRVQSFIRPRWADSIAPTDLTVTEVDEDEAKEIEAAEGKGKEKEKTPAAAGDEDMGQQIKTALLNTYLNSAAIYIKQERWQRALESAKSAQKFDECAFPPLSLSLPASLTHLPRPSSTTRTNPKAKFREGQALIGLGQITAGKRLLEELQQVNPDSAVAAALNKLAQDEVQRSIKAKNELSACRAGLCRRLVGSLSTRALTR